MRRINLSGCHDLMDFNRAFRQYDTLDGANCLTVGKRHLSQREAAVEGVKKTSINQICEVSKNIFDTNDGWDKIYNKRWKVLVESDMKCKEKILNTEIQCMGLFL